MTIVYRVESEKGGIEDFSSQFAAWEFCKANTNYRYIGLVYRFFKERNEF